MDDDLPVAPSGAAAAGGAPHCVFVTGPRGAGKTRWLQRRLRELAGGKPGGRCAVVLAEEGRTRMEGFCRENPGVSVRRLPLPCMCCPGLADLAGFVRDLVEAARPEWLFVEAPALAAASLLADLDRGLGLPRQMYLCLDSGWTLALREDSLAPFQLALIDLADLVIPSPSVVGLRPRSPGSGDRTLSHDPA